MDEEKDSAIVDEPAVAAVEAGPAPVEEPAPAPAPEPAKVSADAPPWAMRRIHEETNRRQEEAKARQAAERRAADLEAVLEKLQKGEKPADGPTPRQPTQGQDYDAAVRAGVERQRFYDDTAAVLNAGRASFSNFDDTLKRLAAVELVTNDGCVADILSVAGRDKAHVLVDQLAGDLEQAERIAKMSQRDRITELTKMVMTEQPKPAAAPEAKPAAKAAPAISKAPPPKPKMDPAGAPVEDNNLLNDNLSDEAWFALYRKERKI